MGEATGYKHWAGERQTQANNNGMIGAKAHKHHGYSVPDADPVGALAQVHGHKPGAGEVSAGEFVPVFTGLQKPCFVFKRLANDSISMGHGLDKPMQHV